MYKTLFYLFIINFSFFCCTYYLGIERSFINYDYIIVAILLAYNFKKTANLIFILIFIADILICAQKIFPFYRFEDIAYILKFLWISSIYYQILFFLLFFIIFLHIYISLKLEINKRITSYFFILFTLLFSFLEIKNVYFSNGDSNVYSKLIKSNLNEFINLQFGLFNKAVTAEVEELQSLPQSLSTQLIRKQIEDGTAPNKVLFIIAESLGYPNNKLILNDMISPLLDKSEYLKDFKVSKATYVGSTVQAELRELCQKKPLNYNFRNLSNGFENCLPNQFKANGYETTVLHGALGIMYDRVYWYPKAGFQNMIFRETKNWKKHCYSFPGACDIEISKIIPEYMTNNKKTFFYWLTLNSHAIYDLRDLEIDNFNCDKFKIKNHSESCRNLKLQTQFFSILAELIDDPKMNGVKVILVGDHSPAIFNQNEKNLIFDGNNVMLMEFKIQNDVVRKG